MFGDADSGDTLIVAAKVQTLPDNVIAGDGIPNISTNGNAVRFAFAAAYRQTDVRASTSRRPTRRVPRSRPSSLRVWTT